MKLSHKIALGYIRTRFRILSLVSPQSATRKAFLLFCTPRRKQPGAVSPIIKKAERLKLTINNYTLHGYRWNTGGTKKILIIHGFESTASNFSNYAASMVKKGHEVVAFDAQAHGISEGKTITLPEYIKTLSLICETYGNFDGYMAHSFGGLALTHLLERIPHDKNTRVVLVAPATETTSAIDHFFNVLRLKKSLRNGFDRLVEEKGGAPPQYYSIRRAIRQLQANILWLHDREDDITPFSDAERVQNENHSNIRFFVTQGLGHRKIYRDETVMNQILDFL